MAVAAPNTRLRAPQLTAILKASFALEDMRCQIQSASAILQLIIEEKRIESEIATAAIDGAARLLDAIDLEANDIIDTLFGIGNGR